MSPFPARRSGPPQPKKRKQKKLAYELIPPNSAVGSSMYALMDELITLHHEELIGARIALAWCKSWKPDVDGRVTLGKCKKASDLDRELAAFDFVVMLSPDFWQNLKTTAVQRRALLDHELCHATVACDEDGEPKEDERGRRVFRMRRHDLEEFGCIAERYGVWKRDIEAFSDALDRAASKATGFVGPSVLKRALDAIGLDIALTTIGLWSGVEKRAAMQWALLMGDPAVKVSSAPPPVHVLQACGSTLPKAFTDRELKKLPATADAAGVQQAAQADAPPVLRTEL